MCNILKIIEFVSTVQQDMSTVSLIVAAALTQTVSSLKDTIIDKDTFRGKISLILVKSNV